MGGAFGYRPGGIAGLCVFWEDHEEAVQYELLRVGLRLRGPGRAVWSEVRAVVACAGPGSALADAVVGHRWTADTAMLANAVDLLARGNWQRQGKKGSRAPLPVPRPWAGPDKQVLGSDPLPAADFNNWWGSQTWKGAGGV